MSTVRSTTEKDACHQFVRCTKGHRCNIWLDPISQRQVQVPNTCGDQSGSKSDRLALGWNLLLVGLETMLASIAKDYACYTIIGSRTNLIWTLERSQLIHQRRGTRAATMWFDVTCTHVLIRGWRRLGGNSPIRLCSSPHSHQPKTRWWWSMSGTSNLKGKSSIHQSSQTNLDSWLPARVMNCTRPNELSVWIFNPSLSSQWCR